MAKSDTYTIHDSEGNPITVLLKREKRLKKSARWTREPDGSILLRIPYRMPRRHIKGLLEDIGKQIGKQRKRAVARSDDDLQVRAEQINKRYFRGEIEWTAIRWVGNMKRRLGSCTNGGSTDGHIRLSERIRAWPDWVVDYIIAHELAHRVHSNHSRDFWQYLEDAYPLTERARGFIIGIGFSQNEFFEEDSPPEA